MKPVYILIDSVTVIRANAFTLKLELEKKIPNTSGLVKKTKQITITGLLK